MRLGVLRTARRNTHGILAGPRVLRHTSRDTRAVQESLFVLLAVASIIVLTSSDW